MIISIICMSVPIKGKDLDLNSLFSLSFNYNFDILKNVIEGLILHQNELEEKLSETVREIQLRDKEREEVIKK